MDKPIVIESVPEKKARKHNPLFIAYSDQLQKKYEQERLDWSSEHPQRGYHTTV